MWFWTLLEVASMPDFPVLLIRIFGVVFASEYFNILRANARKYMTKVLFVAFTFEEIISWWYMPVNNGITFVFGGILDRILVKILKPEKHLEGFVIATCSAGNLDNMMIILIPAICDEKGSPFGEFAVCTVRGMTYASCSMAACLNLNQSR